MTFVGDPSAHYGAGHGDRFLVCRQFKDNQGALVPGAFVEPDRAALWGDRLTTALKAQSFIRPVAGSRVAWRILRAFRDHLGPMEPGYDVPPERSDEWPERTTTILERQTMIERRTYNEPESVAEAAPADAPDPLKAAFVADGIVAPQPRKKRGPYKKRAKKNKE